jgi:hypothetical protein
MEIIVVVVELWAKVSPAGAARARMDARAIRSRKDTGNLSLIASFLHL